MRRTVYRIIILVVMAALIAGCSADAATEGEVTGIVTEVTGDLIEIQSFVVMDAKGDSHKFSPGEGVTFMGAPLSHLRDHIVSGEPVRVTYRTGAGGSLIAIDVLHADAEPGDRHEG